MNDDLETTLYHGTACPTCGAANNAATWAGGEHGSPEDGDLSICFTCTEPMVFIVTNGRLGVRAPDADERAEIDTHPQIIAIRGALTMWHGTGGEL